MPLNATPRAGGGKTSQAQQEQTAPRPQPRPQVSYGVQKASTARVEALKAKLTAKPAPQQAQAPRRAGSSARAEEFAALKKFTAPGQAPIPQQQARRNVSPDGTDLNNVAPPPSGRIPGTEQAPQEELSQNHNSIETPTSEAATSEVSSAQFLALAKQEQVNRKAQLKLKADREAFEREKTEYIRKSDLVSRPLDVLSEAGINEDRLVELQVNRVNPDPNQALLTKIAQLEERLASVDEQFTKRDTQQYDAAVNQIRRDAKLVVDSDPTFETIKSEGATEEIVELVKRVFNEEGTILSVEEAAGLVEEKLLNRKFEDYQRLSQLSKIKSRLAPPAEPAEANPVPQHTQNQTTTLTRTGASERPLTARERGILAIERAKARE